MLFSQEQKSEYFEWEHPGCQKSDFCLYYLLLIVNRAWRAFIVSLSLYSLDITGGENPEFLMSKTLHMQGEILDGLQRVSQYFTRMEGFWAKEHETEMTYARKLEMYATSSILSFDWLALFLMCFQTMYTDEWTSKGIPATTQWDGLCRATLICGFVQTMQGSQ